MGADAVRAMVRSGELKAEDLIRKDGTAKWLTIASVPQLAADLPKPPAPPPDELGLHEVVAPRAVPTSVGSAPLPAARTEDGKRLQPVEVPMMVLLSVSRCLLSMSESPCQPCTSVTLDDTHEG